MNIPPPDEPIISLRRLFKWAVWGGIFWLLLSWIIVPIGMNEWLGFTKYGRIVDEQGNPLPGVVIVSAFRSAGGFHGSSFGCADRHVTQTNAAGEYEIPHDFWLTTTPINWGWGFAPYKPGWLRQGEDIFHSLSTDDERLTDNAHYHYQYAFAPRPWNLEWVNGGLRQHIPDLVMKPSTLPPGIRIEYLWMLKQAMTCKWGETLNITADIFREAHTALCTNIETGRFTKVQMANYEGIWAEQPGRKKAVNTDKLFDEAADPWEPERVKVVCELLQPVGDAQ